MNNELYRMLVRLAVKEARTITDDQEALAVKVLYKEWGKQIGNPLEAGEYVQYNDKLYRVLQAHTAQANWIPGIGTESLFVVIDKEHSGTLEDPIQYTANMEVFANKYYIEDGVVYKCTRDSGIALHNKASDLIGIYFELVG